MVTRLICLRLFGLMFGYNRRLGFFFSATFPKNFSYIIIIWIDICVLINYVSLISHHPVSKILFHVSRLDQTVSILSNDERWYDPRRTILFYLSKPPGATFFRLPSCSSTLDHLTASRCSWIIIKKSANRVIFIYSNVMCVSFASF